MNDLDKVKAFLDIADANENVVNVSQLKAKVSTDRRARRAIFMARKAGYELKAVREGARNVVAYEITNADVVDRETAFDRIMPKRQIKAAKAAAVGAVKDVEVQEEAVA